MNNNGHESSPPDSKMSRCLAPVPAAAVNVNPNRIYDQNSNPLLIGEIANHVLSYLDSFGDLESCFDVCQVWRSLVPAHNIRIRPTRPRVSIHDDLSNRSIHEAYLASIVKHKSFKATKFTFMGTDLGSLSVINFLNEHGDEIEELEIWYDDTQGTQDSMLSRRWNSPQFTARILVELLKEKVPKLKTLLFKHIPLWWRVSDQFHNDGNGNQQLFMMTLTKLAITTERIHCHYGSTTYFLSRLFAATPQLEEFQLMRCDEGLGFGDSGLAESAVHALIDTRRLHQIKGFEFFCVQAGCLHLLSAHLAPNQLVTLRIFNIIYEGTSLDAALLQKLLNNQSGSLKHLELSKLAKVNPHQLIFPPMPNLIELKLGLASSPGFPFKLAYNYGALNYLEYFPRLRVLGLSGLLQNYAVDEIYPDPDTNSELFTCSSVEVLQKIPLGVDAAIMSRIGRLFPNLKIIRISIPFEQESLLVSIWKFCSNITELFLTFGSDHENGTISTPQQDENSARDNQSLDSLFSGIPDTDCRRLRELPVEELKLELAKLKMDEPSLRDLKQLRRFCIDGPARIMDTPPKPTATRAASSSGASALPPTGHTSASCRPKFIVALGRRDRLTNVFGYSTVAEISEEFVFFQGSLGLVEMTPDCVQHVCEENRLECVNESSLGFDPNAVRLIKSGLGFEQLGPVLPAEWYGN